MNVFDSSIINFLHGFFGKSEFFDSTLGLMTENNLVKGGVVVAILWYLWFRKNDNVEYNRGRIVVGMLSCIIAVVVARTLALTLPYRVRPYLNPDINFGQHFEKQLQPLDSWSSFPSDHAVMFFSLATCIFLISRRIGLLTYLYVILFICFPRVYLGYHYASDLVVGAIVGILITLILSMNKISKPIVRMANQFATASPGLFYAMIFLLTFQIATMFFESRDIVAFLVGLTHHQYIK
jgi:undecaprenyl-diphosphatase